MTISDELVRILKRLEGFRAYAYWDHKQYSIGYGSKCPEGYEKYYQSHPITEEYAEELMRGELKAFEEQILAFAKRNGMEFNQHQFDALVSFTYNVGGNWTNSSTSNLSSAIISGDTGPRLLYGMMLYSMAGGRHTLVSRRCVETNMYLNGVYPEDPLAKDAAPANYRIAFMDGNGGVVRYDEHGFDALQPSGIRTYFTDLPTGPDENGIHVTYVLEGWYTQRIGGTKVEVLDESIVNGTMLYAHWMTPSGTPVIIPQLESGLKVPVTVTGNNVNVRSGPDTYYASLFKASKGDVVLLSAVVTVGTSQWGRFGDCWISLNYTDYNQVISSLLPIWGKITANTLNVRTGPGTDYETVEGLRKKNGDLVQVSEWKSDGQMMWGKIAEGWIALPYVTFEGVSPVQTITIHQLPGKLSYVQMAEQLDLTGCQLLVTYVDGTTEIVDVTADMISGFDNAVIGNNTVTITYGYQTAVFEVQIIKAKITFVTEDGSVITQKEYLYGETVEIPQAPAKDADKVYTYTFAGWDREVIPCAGDAVYVATYTPVNIEYTIVFKGEDGSVLAEQIYHWGDKIAPPSAPEKPDDNVYHYTFAGWDKEVVDCAGDAEYTATYTPVNIEYTVTFKNEDGTVLSQEKYHWGAQILCPETPAKDADRIYTYTFAGWDKEVVDCAGDAEYIATYTPVYIKYTVIFKNEDGTVLSQNDYHWGDEVAIPENPSKAADNTYTYTFAGWDQEVVPCAGQAVYTATYTPVYIDYTVIFKDENGTVLSEQIYHWGDPVTIPAEPTKEANLAVTYEFAGWDAEVSAACSGNATYTATYRSVYIDYTVTFQYEDGTIFRQLILHYGDAVEMPDEPAAMDGFYFAGWDREITACRGNTVYTAVFLVPGDVDGNGTTSTDDVIQLLLHVSMPDLFPLDINADYTSDGTVTTDDVVQLLLHVSMPDMFPLHIAK